MSFVENNFDEQSWRAHIRYAGSKRVRDTHTYTRVHHDCQKEQVQAVLLFTLMPVDWHIVTTVNEDPNCQITQKLTNKNVHHKQRDIHGIQNTVSPIAMKSDQRRRITDECVSQHWPQMKKKNRMKSQSEDVYWAYLASKNVDWRGRNTEKMNYKTRKISRKLYYQVKTFIARKVFKRC